MTAIWKLILTLGFGVFLQTSLIAMNQLQREELSVQEKIEMMRLAYIDLQTRIESLETCLAQKDDPALTQSQSDALYQELRDLKQFEPLAARFIELENKKRDIKSDVEQRQSQVLQELLQLEEIEHEIETLRTAMWPVCKNILKPHIDRIRAIMKPIIQAGIEGLIAQIESERANDDARLARKQALGRMILMGTSVPNQDLQEGNRVICAEDKLPFPCHDLCIVSEILPGATHREEKKTYFAQLKTWCKTFFTHAS